MRARPLASLFVATTLILSALLGLKVVPSYAVGSYDNAKIADIALGYLGKWGGEACRTAHKLDNHSTGKTVGGYGAGQCKTFVNCVVFLASGGDASSRADCVVQTGSTRRTGSPPRPAEVRG
jgi:hypothetical protein